MANDETSATARRKNPARLITVLVTAILLVAVAVAVTHNPTHQPPVSVKIVQGEPLVPQPQPASPAAPAPAKPAAPVAASTLVAPPRPLPGYATVGFDRLAGFLIQTKWQMTDPIRIKGVQKMQGEVPDSVKALDRSKIAVQGFMLPYQTSADGKVSDFFLMRTQAKCCFGLPIQMNELLTVHMTGTGVKSQMDQPITVYGTLHIAESHDAATGVLTSIYQLDGEKLDTPAAL